MNTTHVNYVGAQIELVQSLRIIFGCVLSLGRSSAVVVFVIVSTAADVLSYHSYGGAARVKDTCGVSGSSHHFLDHAVEVIFRTLTCLAKDEQATLILLVGELVVVAHTKELNRNQNWNAVQRKLVAYARPHVPDQHAMSGSGRAEIYGIRVYHSA